jgi:fatty acid synthase subunit alpha
MISTRLTWKQLHGDAAEAAKKAGVKEISISISHSDSQAIAIAVATF